MAAYYSRLLGLREFDSDGGFPATTFAAYAQRPARPYESADRLQLLGLRPICSWRLRLRTGGRRVRQFAFSTQNALLSLALPAEARASFSSSSLSRRRYNHAFRWTLLTAPRVATQWPLCDPQPQSAQRARLASNVDLRVTEAVRRVLSIVYLAMAAVVHRVLIVVYLAMAAVVLTTFQPIFAASRRDQASLDNRWATLPDVLNVLGCWGRSILGEPAPDDPLASVNQYDIVVQVHCFLGQLPSQAPLLATAAALCNGHPRVAATDGKGREEW